VDRGRSDLRLDKLEVCTLMKEFLSSRPGRNLAILAILTILAIPVACLGTGLAIERILSYIQSRAEKPKELILNPPQSPTPTPPSVSPPPAPPIHIHIPKPGKGERIEFETRSEWDSFGRLKRIRGWVRNP